MAKCKICIEMVKIRGEKYRSFFLPPLHIKIVPPLAKVLRTPLMGQTFRHILQKNTLPDVT